MSVLSSPPKLGGVRGGLNRRKLRRIIRRFIRRNICRNIRRFIRRFIRHIIPLFRPPLAPHDSGGRNNYRLSQHVKEHCQTPLPFVDSAKILNPVSDFQIFS